MATLYYATNGTQWGRADKWLSADAICSWYPALPDQCTNTTERLRRRLQQTQNLIRLDLSANYLQGSLPDELVFPPVIP